MAGLSRDLGSVSIVLQSLARYRAMESETQHKDRNYILQDGPFEAKAENIVRVIESCV